jgi:hypothetical protein
MPWGESTGREHTYAAPLGACRLEPETLEKVGDSSAGRHRLLGLGHFVEEEEVAMKLFVELENGCHIATSVAVVGRRPYRDQVLLREKF